MFTVNSKSKTFYAFCFSFVLGVGAFSFVGNNDIAFYLYIAIFVLLFFSIILWSKKLMRFILLCALFFAIGGWRFVSTIPSGKSSEISHFNGANFDIAGWISSEPDIRISETRYILNVESCKTRSFACPKNISGKILVKLPSYPQYYFGDSLKLKCGLQSPENNPEGNLNYEKYLAKDGIFSICLSPKVSSNSAPSKIIIKFVKSIYNLKSFFQNQIDRLWPEPQSSFMAGLLYGSRRGLPAELLENFNKTGITHIIAVSGFNISIIATYLMLLLVYLGFYRQRAFWILVTAIIFFVIFTGASASVVRAGIMGIIVLLARHIGRVSSVGALLVFTAAMMALINPYVLIWDVGFQLSFLATIGLICLSPRLEKRWKFWDGKYLKFFKEIFIATISAIITTFPLVLFQFGRFSVVAPLVNILVLWLIPFLMLFGFVALVASFLIFPLGQVLAWFAGLGLNYVIMTVEWFGNKSWSAINISIPFWLMATM